MEMAPSLAIAAAALATCQCLMKPRLIRGSNFVFPSWVPDWMYCSHNPKAVSDAVSASPLFGALCFCYCLAGVAEIAVWYGVEGAQTHPQLLSGEYPFVMEGCLLLLQGFLSHMADYQHVGDDASLYHGWDRLLAWPLTITQIYKCYLMASQPTSWPSLVLAYNAIMGVGMYCRYRSWGARLGGDAPGYIYWHCGWHTVIPLGAALHHTLITVLI